MEEGTSIHAKNAYMQNALAQPTTTGALPFRSVSIPPIFAVNASVLTTSVATTSVAPAATVPGEKTGAPGVRTAAPASSASPAPLCRIIAHLLGYLLHPGKNGGIFLRRRRCCTFHGGDLFIPLAYGWRELDFGG